MDWTEPLFAQADKTVRTALKNHLRDHGLYVGGKSKVTQQLVDLLDNGKVPEWPEEDLDKERKAKRRNFKSHTFNPGFDQPECTETSSEVLPTRKLRSLIKTPKATETTKDLETAKEPKEPAKKTKKTGGPVNPSEDDGLSVEVGVKFLGDSIGGKDTPVVDQVKSLTQFLANTDLTSAPYPVGTGRLLTELGKVYNDDKKFSGEKYDVLDAKLKIFFDLCDKIGIP